MKPLLTADEMRLLDARTISGIGLPGAVLMETAGRGVFRWLQECYGDRLGMGPTAVVCGKGNNGGDGFVVARSLQNLGLPVTAFLLDRRDAVQGDAAIHLKAYLASGGTLVEVDEAAKDAPPHALRSAPVIVDAVLGTGLSDEVRGLPARAIAWIGSCDAPVVSVDLPSGVSSDTGKICGIAVRADLTVTFAYPKRGHYLFPGGALTGRLEVVEIGIPPSLLDSVSPGLLLVERGDCEGLLERPLDSHKGIYGHVVAFGGSPGKEGAPGLAAAAALRAGAGLSTVAAPAGVCRYAASRYPLEVMTVPLPEPSSEETEWREELWFAATEARELADALVLGPGMGTGDGAAGFLRRALAEAKTPLVLDADALNLLSADPSTWRSPSAGAVLTPHPGEAARLLGATTAAVQEDRVGAARTLADRFGSTVVLKGAHTLVAAPDAPVSLIREGNPGMATAGSGDVLSGVIGAFLARGLDSLDAARLGVYVHGMAGDLAGRELGWEGMTAGDVLASLPKALCTIGARTR